MSLTDMLRSHLSGRFGSVPSEVITFTDAFTWSGATVHSGTLTSSGGLTATGAVDLSGATVTLPASQMKGYIPLPLAEARLIASSDIAAKNATDGGLVSLDTAPTFKRVNGATDPQLRISWAANGVVPITWHFNYPPDLDDTATVAVKLLIGKDTNTDATAVVGVAYWEGVGSSDVGGNTAALGTATVTLYTVTITAANIGAYPKAAVVALTPAAHSTDAEYLYGAWIEYTRKTS